MKMNKVKVMLAMMVCWERKQIVNSEFCCGVVLMHCIAVVWDFFVFQALARNSLKPVVV